MEIEFYPPGDGQGPAFQYIFNLTEKERIIIFNGLDVIKTMEFPQAKQAGSIKKINKKEKIHEFIIGDHRLTFFVINRACWILHGFRKKSQKTPPGEIKIAINLKYKLLQELGEK